MSLPEVAFYLLPHPGPNGRCFFACRVAEKAFRLGLPVYVQTASPAAAQRMDDMLWTFRDDSFLPHERYRVGQQEYPPILVGYSGLAFPEVAKGLLINLDIHFPVALAQFQRIAELVGPEESERLRSRALYRQYRDQACPLETHTIKR